MKKINRLIRKLIKELNKLPMDDRDNIFFSIQIIQYTLDRLYAAVGEENDV